MHTATQPLGLYLHVPFCVSKCPYCDFYSQKIDAAAADAYTQRLCSMLRAHPFGPRTVDTLYFGGGTPALLGAKRLDAILQAAAEGFSLAAGAEITLEANPADATPELLCALRNSGVTRLSLGVQSLHDAELHGLGRRHSAQQATRAIEAAAAAGFANLSADLMLGIPLQTRKSLRQTLQAFSRLPLTHVSAYLLKIEEGTPFARCTPALPDEDTLATLYLDCVEQLEAAGFQQYEISNFARRGAASRHNLKYWRCEPYVGLGPAAHSFLDGKRFFFPADLQAFLHAPDPFALAVPDGGGGGFEEEAMLRLRLREGLDTKRFSAADGERVAALLQRARPLAQKGLLHVYDGIVALTPQGFLLSSSVTAHLLYSAGS